MSRLAFIYPKLCNQVVANIMQLFGCAIFFSKQNKCSWNGGISGGETKRRYTGCEERF